MDEPQREDRRARAGRPAGGHLERVLDQMLPLLVFTGLRPNEVLALRWDGLDRERRVIRVVRGISDGHVVDRPKTERGVRAVPLTDELHGALEAHRRELLARQPAALGEGWIFPSDRPRGPRLPNWGFHAVRGSVTAAKLQHRLTASGLRRSWIDAARRVALDPIVVRQVVGHADDAMRGWYSTVGIDEVARAGASVARLIAGKSGPSSGPSDGSEDATAKDGG